MRELAAGLTSREMTELLAMDWLEPGVGARIDQGFASLLHMIYSRTRGKSEPQKTADDFMPKRGPLDRRKVGDKARVFGSQLKIQAEIERMKRNRG